ncbi:helix-turn-helix transcriptional regulator [Paratractidigestivibacter sp.]|uniref:helix-turn-helix domain-containing protein n=1 Tax=Paratractidigestivibacter sp. TaxID=2847316 RepID=UPI002ABEA059|nr:helix-turn-helix transcriptional regulator [Paratractidigestivibacter sp.]
MSKPTIDMPTVYAAIARHDHTGLREAARYMGIDRKTFYGYMNGSTPRLDTACKIADYCECGLDDLVRWPR